MSERIEFLRPLTGIVMAEGEVAAFQRGRRCPDRKALADRPLPRAELHSWQARPRRSGY